ncbi:ABC transporter substrate-binding protein [Kitasatospora sp. DSM 101779]|uniref:ABC transporter substrate-binding protein n=1 Tax=Kitasatospora sp. DSM 101779 TaxID=2853165 RepID=UPI0021DA926D|nr:ABC transporter substrate-binding protein [Kitasatospora sp. DSM 101779]MCU7827037.1 ABC transporter substrate-binding protein [Kitasatospora sp. DSM 101779]
MHRLTLRAPRTLAAGAALLAGTVLLTACGSSDAGKPSEDDLHARLPESVRTKGVLKIASDLNYAPVEFKASDGSPVGIDPDIATALGKQLGVTVEFTDTAFDKLIPGLQAGEFDLAMSAMTDNRQRREGTDDNGKVVNPGVDFVDYFIAGTQMLVPKGNQYGIAKLDDLCGHTVALQRGTTQATIIDRQVGACARLRKPLTVKLFDNDNEALAEVAAGRADADLNDYPVAAYVAAKGGPNGAKFDVAGAQLQPSPYGIAVDRKNTELRDVLVRALNQMIRSNEYETILRKWGVTAGAVQNAVVNGGF